MDGEMQGPTEPVSLGRRLLNGWMAIAGRFGFVQTLVILTLFYAAFLGPVGLVLSLTRRDLLDKRRLRRAGSAWQDADSAAPDLERAKTAS
jgi:hypothetical protein